MKKSLTVICILLLLYSCNPQSNSSTDKKNTIGDTISDKKTADTSIDGLDQVVDSLKREIGDRTG